MVALVVALAIAATGVAIPAAADDGPMLAQAADPSDVGTPSDPEEHAPDAPPALETPSAVEEDAPETNAAPEPEPSVKPAEPVAPEAAVPDADPAPSFLLPRPWDATLAGAVGCAACGGPFACVGGAMITFAVMLFSSAVAEGGWGGCILAIGAIMVGIFAAVPGMLAGPASSVGTCASGSVLAMFTDRKVWPFFLGLIPGLTVGLLGAALTLSPIILADTLEPLAVDAGLEAPLVTFGIAAAGIIVGLTAGPLSVAAVTYADHTFNANERASTPPHASNDDAPVMEQSKRTSPPSSSEMRPAVAFAY